jgi:endonuclease YncB( thermonuclease family)
MAALALCTPLLARADDSSAGSKDAPKTEVRKKKAAVIQGDTVDVTGKREMPVQMVLTRDPSAKHAFDDSIDEHVRDAAQGH